MNENEKAVPLKQLQTISAPNQQLSAFTSMGGFELVQRMAQGLMTATLIPERYQQSIGNTMIAINMAQRLNCDPLMVMQNLYVVKGNPAWSGQFVIAAINQSGMFKGPLRFIEVGTRDAKTWGFYAEATSKDDHVIKGPTVTMQLAHNEGWVKKNPKWVNMPEMMLRYRAGSWFGRTECPEILMGFQSAEEVNDFIEVDPETGEVIGESAYATPKTVKVAAPKVTPGPAKPQTEDSVESVEISGVGDIPETVEVVQDGEVVGTVATEAKPEPASSHQEQLDAQGWYEDSNRKFNAHGEIWTDSAHATGRDGNPIINSDGHYRMRRGGALPGTEVETAKPDVVDDGGTNQEAPTPGYEKEPEFVDGPDNSNDWMEGLE